MCGQQACGCKGPHHRGRQEREQARGTARAKEGNVEGTKSHAKWLDLGKQRHSGMGQDCIFPEGP